MPGQGQNVCNCLFMSVCACACVLQYVFVHEHSETTIATTVMYIVVPGSHMTGHMTAPPL